MLLSTVNVIILLQETQRMERDEDEAPFLAQMCCCCAKRLRHVFVLLLTKCEVAKKS